jgi:hypothetical protein
MKSRPINVGSAVRTGLFVLALFGANMVVAEANELENGGFEDAAVEPGSSRLGLDRYGAWTSPAPGGCSGSTEILGLPYPTGFGAAAIAAYEGDQALNLGPCFGTGSISQSFTTVVGARYEVSLALRDGQVTASVFNPSASDFSADFGLSGDLVWTIYRFTFMASETRSTILLQNSSLSSSDCCAPTVDDIRVTRIPNAVGI